MNKRIVVIGAGAAGVAATTALLGAGFNKITLVEAEPRIGGRVHTIPFGKNVVDMGAQWYANMQYKLINFLFSVDLILSNYYSDSQVSWREG